MNHHDGDRAARNRALEPHESFIVEAPAGSGKTELLTQRMLRLLDCVDLPEQVLAITFTRKAAAEMRQRLIETLRAAASEAATVPEHRRASLDLARAVLRRSERLGWSIMEQSQRLRILTIDALNVGLARQLPLLTGGVVGARIADNADLLYRLAAKRTTESLPDDGPVGAALRHLLEVADNSLTKLESWLAAALSQRDRWIRALEQAAQEDLPALVQANIVRLHEGWGERLTALTGEADSTALHALLRRRGGAYGESRPATESSAAELWREAAATLLTAKGTWRQRLTKREGFGSDAQDLRTAVMELQGRLRTRAGLEDALAEFAGLPPRTLEPEQRIVLEALVPVLKHLLAELKVVFATSACVDHSELALAAQDALGAVDAPSDLLLALDRRIEHILVDEFQDTSHLQWGLLERLTAGWQAGDGRSLFLVGDPMQSIYRFRDADLSLFHRARQEGIGAVRFEPIRLAVNFRSAVEIVDWVNATFPAMFSANQGSATRGPEFSVAVSGRGSQADAGVSLEMLPVDGHDGEIERIVTLVKAEWQRYPDQSIGILVRSRAHLAGLRAALRRAEIEAQAVEIDSLTDTPLGLDLIALTSALLHEGDRLAWLALLRSPCCGLRWSDLHALLDGAGEHTIRSLIDDAGHRGRLSPDGCARSAWLAERLRRADALRAGLSLGAWIRECWLLIDGPAALDDPDALALAETFFRELDLLARGGDLEDPATLLRRFERPSVRAVPSRTGIELMTIHRAKGLEFDTVIVPGLSRRTRGPDSRLLLLQDIVSPNGERLRLLAGAARDDALLKFLRRNELAEERRERARLLYVAATRAKRRLVLLAGIGGKARPHRDSLLALLAPDPVTGDAEAVHDATREESSDEPTAAPQFRELPLERMELAEIPLPPTAMAGETDRSVRPEFEWANPGSVQVGTLIHRELQRLCERAAVAGKPLAPQSGLERYRRELALLGIEPEDVSAAAERVREALESVWNDPTGRRILHPWAEAWSELRLSWRGRDRIEHLQIDRSFVDDDGLRWIIDYKTGRHLGSNVEGFLESEVARYRPQLERYAEAVAAIDGRPLRVGLYFPLLRRLRDWVPAVASRS